MAKPNYTQILNYVASHPMDILALIALASAVQSKDKKQINKAAKNLLGIIASEIDTTDPDVKAALSDLSAALSK